MFSSHFIHMPIVGLLEWKSYRSSDLAKCSLCITNICKHLCCILLQSNSLRLHSILRSRGGHACTVNGYGHVISPPPPPLFSPFFLLYAGSGSEYLTCTFSASCCSARLSRTQVPAFVLIDDLSVNGVHELGINVFVLLKHRPGHNPGI